MKFLDLLSMSVNNLRRRKLRTFLTVLGVVIGTASIVVMVSLGIGLNELTTEMYASFGSLTEIEISSDDYYGGPQEGKDPNYLTDDVLKKVARIAHVDSVSPMLSVQVMMKQGVYEGYGELIGVTRNYMKNIPLKEGHIPDADAKGLEMVVGNMVPRRFHNPKAMNRQSGYVVFGGEEEESPVDFMNKPMFVVFDMDKYYQSQGGGVDESGSPIKPPKKYMLPTAGLVEGGMQDWNNYSYGIYVDIELLKNQLKQVFKKNPVPGQPLNKKGKPYNYFIYERAVVQVDDKDNVIEVQKQLADMGYNAHSNMDGLKQSQQQSQMVQAVLGGIGAVSLFVAAIGIANTMMMSIYERTREIGVIKVLGCDMRNIRSMFLMESGFIGFMGGVVGIVLSYGLSVVMNRFLSGKFMTGTPGDISRIPLWLSLAAVGFAIFVGMAAGFFPALRAMKLSPLAAIRNE